MERHKQCQQKIGESHNADLTAPQGVTRQTFIDIHTCTCVAQHKSSKGREGGEQNKIIVNCLLS